MIQDIYSIDASGAISALDRVAASAANVVQSQAALASAPIGYEWTNALGNYDAGAMQAVFSTEELVQQGFLVQSAFGEAADTIGALAGTVGELSNAADPAALEGMSGAVNTLSDAVSGLNGSVDTNAFGAFSDRAYASASALHAAGRAQAELSDLGADTAQSLRAESGALDDAAERVRQLNADMQDLSGSQSELANSADKGADSIEQSGQGAQRAASGGFESLLGKLKQLAAAYLGLQAAKEVFKGALEMDNIEVRLRARFGDDDGQRAAEWAQATALRMGQSINGVMGSVDVFSKLTSSGGAIEKLVELSDRMAGYSGNDYSQVADAIAQTMRTGRTQGLTQSFGISKAALEASGFDAAAEAGDYNAMADALMKAADAAGMTAEGFTKIDNAAGGGMADFFGNLRNMAQMAGRGIINAIAPAFARLNEWLTSDSAKGFFDGISMFANIAGAAIDVLVTAFIGIAEFIGSNMVPIITALTAAAAIFGVQALIAGIQALAGFVMANLPIVLLIAGITLLIGWVHSLGYSFEEVFGFIGGVVGVAVAGIMNLFMGLLDLVLGVVNYLVNPFITFANFLANVFTSPISSIVYLFQGMADNVLGILEKIASAIDFVFGSNLAGSVSGWRSGLKTMADEVVAEYAPNESYEKVFQELNLNAADLGFERITYADAFSIGSEIGGKFGAGLDNIEANGLPNVFDQFGGIGDAGLGTIGNIDDNLANMASGGVKVKNEINLSDEDIKMIRDIAERKYIVQVNTTALSPNITTTVNNNGGAADMDAERITKYIEKALQNEIDANTEASYAY